jgi:hypothetical protein
MPFQVLGFPLFRQKKGEGWGTGHFVRLKQATIKV